jgi:hypothetical protein
MAYTSPAEQDDHEDHHLDQGEGAERLEPDRPREDEHGLDVEDQEQQGEDVVADLGLAPPLTDRVDAALVGRLAFTADGFFGRSRELAPMAMTSDEDHPESGEDRDRDVVLEV